MLQSVQVIVDTAICGIDAIEKVEDRIRQVKESGASPYRLVLLDFSLPDIDGPQVCA